MTIKKLFTRNEKGQSLVEMALVLPLLIIILFGIIEFGRVFHSYLVITHAAREGARFGIISKDVGEIKQKVQDASPGIILDIANDNDVKITPLTLTPGVPMTVTVYHEVELFTPILGDILTNPVPIAASSTMRVE